MQKLRERESEKAVGLAEKGNEAQDENEGGDEAQVEKGKDGSGNKPHPMRETADESGNEMEGTAENPTQGQQVAEESSADIVEEQNTEPP